MPKQNTRPLFIHRTATEGLSLRKRRAWFEGEPPATPPATPAPPPTPPAAVPPVTPAPTPPAAPSDDLEEAPLESFPEALRNYIRGLREESKRRRLEATAALTEANRLKDAEKQREEQRLISEKKWEDLAAQYKKERDELQAQLAGASIATLRARIGAEFKLSPRVSERLQGATEAEIREDAKALAADLGLDKAPDPTVPPAPVVPTPPGTRRQTSTAVNPDGTPVGKTDAARRARRLPQESPIFGINPEAVTIRNPAERITIRSK